MDMSPYNTYVTHNIIHMLLCFFFIFVFHFESAMKSPKEAEKLNANARSGLKDKLMP